MMPPLRPKNPDRPATVADRGPIPVGVQVPQGGGRACRWGAPEGTERRMLAPEGFGAKYRPISAQKKADGRDALARRFPE